MYGSKIFLGSGAGGGDNANSIFLTTSDQAPLTSTAKQIGDNAGNLSPLWLSTSVVNIGSGTITNNGSLTVKGAGANVQSWRNSSNVEIASITNGGIFSISSSIVTQSSVSIGNGLVNFIPLSDGVFRLANSAVNDFTRIVLGTNNTIGISLVKNATELRARLGDDSAFCAFRSLSYQSGDLSAGALTAARPVKFGDRASITEAGFVALGLDRQLAIEHNGVVYYIPVAQTLIP